MTTKGNTNTKFNQLEPSMITLTKPNIQETDAFERQIEITVHLWMHCFHFLLNFPALFDNEMLLYLNL